MDPKIKEKLESLRKQMKGLEQKRSDIERDAKAHQSEVDLLNVRCQNIITGDMSSPQEANVRVKAMKVLSGIHKRKARALNRRWWMCSFLMLLLVAAEGLLIWDEEDE